MHEAICFPETVKNRPFDLQNTSHLADDQDPTLILYYIYDCPVVGESQNQAIIIDRFYRLRGGKFSVCGRSDLYVEEKSPGTLGDLTTLTSQLNTAVTNVKNSLTHLLYHPMRIGMTAINNKYTQ